MPAARLTCELRETIRDWFANRNSGKHDQDIVLSALASIMAEQITANPDPRTQEAIAEAAFQAIHTCVVVSNSMRVRRGGVPFTKQ
jgi:uncharacterized protein